MRLQGKSRAETATEATERLLVVTSGPTTVALTAPLIEDILPPEESDATVVVTDQEITYHVSDLASRLGQVPATNAPDARVVLCGYGERHRGFRVDRLLGPTDVDPRHIHPLPPHFTGEERAWIFSLSEHHCLAGESRLAVRSRCRR
jgi:CheW-like domain